MYVVPSSIPNLLQGPLLYGSLWASPGNNIIDDVCYHWVSVGLSKFRVVLCEFVNTEADYSFNRSKLVEVLKDHYLSILLLDPSKRNLKVISQYSLSASQP